LRGRRIARSARMASDRRAMTEAPLLAARDLRVDVDGAVAVEGVTFETRGASAAIAGDGSALLRAIAGNADVRSGTLAGLGLAAGPLSGLAGEHIAYVAAVLASATAGRKWIVSLSNLYAGSEESALAARADELLVFASGRLVRQGKLQKIEDGTVGYTLMLRA